MEYWLSGRSGRVRSTDEEAALTDPVPGDIGAVLGTGAEVGAVSLGLPAHLPTGAVGAAVSEEVAGESGEDVSDGDRIGVEGVRPTGGVAMHHLLHLLSCVLSLPVVCMLFGSHLAAMVPAAFLGVKRK